MVSDKSVPCQIISGKQKRQNGTEKKIKFVFFGTLLCNTWVFKTGSAAL